MNHLPDSLFENPVWHVLQIKHSHLAVSEVMPTAILPRSFLSRQSQRRPLPLCSVAAANRRALDVYLRLGFEVVRTVTLQRLGRNAAL
jgi:hypothetical protein